MRRVVVALVLTVAGAAALAAAGEAGSDAFAPKNRQISRTTFAGITPRMTLAQVRAQWGRQPVTGVGGRAGIGRSIAIWGNYTFTAPTTAIAYYGGRRAGTRPFRYSIHVQYARETGVEIRTARGDRAGTTAAAFRRRWPGSRRIVSEPGYVWYVAKTAYAGGRLGFLFIGGQLRIAELVTADYVGRCYVRACDGYPPGNLH